MRRSRWWWAVVGTVAVLLIGVGSAAALDVGLGQPDPNPGEFVRAGAPVYAAAPDGWACHYLGTNDRLVGGRCVRPEERAAQDPPAAWRSRRVFEPITGVGCRRGWFALIHTPLGRGWVATADISTKAFDRDGHSRIAGCDAFTWS